MKKLLISLSLFVNLVFGTSFDDAFDAFAKADYDKAFKLFEELEKSGDINAQFYLGLFYYDGKGIAKNYEKAIELYEKAANRGDADSQYNLGLIYVEGIATKQDYEKAKYWWEKAAAQKYNSAEFNLGIMYENAEGVKEDKTLAKQWYKKACNNGLEDACSAYEDLDKQGF
ncbi:Beta-lactamase HcpA precursor [Aliarcobacter thereius]|uniref:beta-lactamase n=1 Tax=Aliarcobacter thereius TaxID=544718 RepID=A0A1C0B536_9BACT|nr:tetratricopeptide repeat protein [Aliarcobacter thereius]OCL97562.1 Beta-lactamase HcpA precursor [Aliarcobacter thereius]TLS72943.1 sel1 repeat family protein [Aliarcobacter thereius]